ncbi:hypothetical protein TUM17556_27490 [Enterobacter asburiae]|uniref:hypothetical protein n=1 Tax=Enterobacter asburiae TaxID=61645 RepID=UPI001E2FE698|nr:hypothetical protein [Enterobacter asburiae]GJK30830.1 hypothetical protein TUM17556_27490 [Enterobacter asburiae]
MSTITKEWLQSQISAIKAVDITESNTLQAFEIALASLEAEAAGIVRHIELRGPEHPAGIHVSLYSRLDDGIELYTAPPAPTVPNECPAEIRELMASYSDALFDDGDAQEIWNACRAAMLQGADGNSQVIPECSCRACRPVTISDMRFVVCPDCGNKRCPHANDHRNACTGSNEPGQEGSAYPAAPQQEVK